MHTESNRLSDDDALHLDLGHAVDLGRLSTLEVKALEHELGSAAKMQRQLFPCCVPNLDNLEIAVHLKPAGIVSGDFFDFFRYQETGQGVLISDVMGKGLSASMLMASIQASMRVLGADYYDLGEMTNRLNWLFKDQMMPGIFASMVVLAQGSDKHTIQYVNAGHLPPLVWRSQTKSVEWLKPTGPAIGLMQTPQYQSKVVEMGPGDVMMLYTDGLVEARNDTGEEFGAGRLIPFIEKHQTNAAQDIVNALRKTSNSFMAGKQLDDLTLLVLKWY